MVDNQHKQIKGYRDLSPDDIAAMNDCKAVEAQFNGMIDRLRLLPGVDQRNVALAQTHGEDAFMRAVRSIAQPERLTVPVPQKPKYPPHIERVIVEYRELNDRWQKLGEFSRGSVFPTLSLEERDAMVKQHDAMDTYASVLMDRLNRAGVSKLDLI